MQGATTTAYRLARAQASDAAVLAQRFEDGEDLSDTLSARELVALKGLRTDKRRRDWLVGRLAAKRLLSAALAEEGRAPARLSDVPVLSRPDGSPYCPCWPEDAGPCLSISHCAGEGVAALARPKKRVGVDLELVEPRPESWLEIFAHPSERERLLGPAEQTRLWTLKEAALKLLGLGLSTDLWNVRFPDPAQDEAQLHQEALLRWQALGRPLLRFQTRQTGGECLSVAYTQEVPV